MSRGALEAAIADALRDRLGLGTPRPPAREPGVELQVGRAVAPAVLGHAGVEVAMKTRVPSSVTVQAKPRMTQPGDAAEREADRLAEAALDPSRGAAPLVATAAQPRRSCGRSSPSTRRTTASTWRRRRGRRRRRPLPPASWTRSGRAPAGGRSTPGVRGRMEHGFGRSFEDVRIHADGSSARLSDSIDARAFTHGRDIYFGRGEYSPGTQAGDRLLAHELAHTLQQAPPERIARSERPRTAEEIRQEAQATLDGWRREFQADPSIDAAELASIIMALDRARRDAAGISDPAQQATRIGYLEAELAMLEDPFYAWVHTRKISYASSAVATVGNPEIELEPPQLARLDAHRKQMRLGPDAYLSFFSQQLVMRRQPVEAPEAEGAGAGTDVTGGLDTAPPEGQGLDPASIEALRVNRLIGEKEPGSEEREPSSVFLQMQRDVAEQRAGAKTVRGIASNLDRIKAEVLPDDLKREFAGIDFGFSLFFAETAMIMGLLAGAGERSPEVDDAGKELVKTLQDVSRRIVEELAWIATETALFAAATIASEGALIPVWVVRAGTLAKRLKSIQQLVSTLTAAYRTTSRITELVQTVRALRAQYPAFLAQYERAMTEFERLQRALESFDAEEDVEAALEHEEERLVEMIDQQLDGQLGAVLEMLYIPEDTPPDELLGILFDIPRGLTALDDMWSFYEDDSQQQNEQFGDILAIKAFLAGHYLFPFVGLASSLVSAQLQTIFPERSYEDRFNKLITARAGPAGRGKRHRDVFGRLNRKRYSIKSERPREARGGGPRGAREGDRAARAGLGRRRALGPGLVQARRPAGDQDRQPALQDAHGAGHAPARQEGRSRPGPRDGPAAAGAGPALGDEGQGHRQGQDQPRARAAEGQAHRQGLRRGRRLPGPGGGPREGADRLHAALRLRLRQEPEAP